MSCFTNAVTNRRSIYALGKNIPVLESEIIAVVERMTKEVPSPFNIQSQRVVVAMDEYHENVWDITTSKMKEILTEEAFVKTAQKLETFKAAYGTILFFEEIDIVHDMQKKFPTYADSFPIWAAQANGMLQFAIWTELENMGLGVNIQHYNPLINVDIISAFNIPDNWELAAQMVFGEKLQPAGAIEKIPVSERVKVFR